MRELEIIKDAINAGLCKEWQSDFKANPSLQNLCAKYFEGSDWAMQKDFPNLITLRQYRGISDEFGLFTDFEGTLENRSKVALFGDSKADLVYNQYQVGEIYIRHNSQVKLYARENSVVIVNILDASNVELVAEDNAKIIVYYYGFDVCIKHKGNVYLKQRKFDE